MVLFGRGALPARSVAPKTHSNIFLSLGRSCRWAQNKGKAWRCVALQNMKRRWIEGNLRLLGIIYRMINESSTNSGYLGELDNLKLVFSVKPRLSLLDETLSRRTRQPNSSL